MTAVDDRCTTPGPGSPGQTRLGVRTPQYRRCMPGRLKRCDFTPITTAWDEEKKEYNRMNDYLESREAESHMTAPNCKADPHLGRNSVWSLLDPRIELHNLSIAKHITSNDALACIETHLASAYFKRLLASNLTARFRRSAFLRYGLKSDAAQRTVLSHIIRRALVHTTHHNNPNRYRKVVLRMAVFLMLDPTTIELPYDDCECEPSISLSQGEKYYVPVRHKLVNAHDWVFTTRTNAPPPPFTHFSPIPLSSDRTPGESRYAMDLHIATSARSAEDPYYHEQLEYENDQPMRPLPLPPLNFGPN